MLCYNRKYVKNYQKIIGRVRRIRMYASEKEDNMVNIPGRKPGKIRRVIAYVLMIAILAGILPQEAFAAAETEKSKTTSEYVSEDCDIVYKTVSSWGNYANVDISITNNGDRKLTGWEIEFPYDAVIENIWNADLLRTDNGKCYVAAKSYNAEIQKGQTVSFGFTARAEKNTPQAPCEMVLTDKNSRKNEESKEEDNTSKDNLSAIFPEKWKGMNYTIFASEETDLSLYTYKTNVTGDVHSNGGFKYQGTTLNVQGCLSAGKNIQIQTSSMEGAKTVTKEVENSTKISMPDITKEIRDHIKEHGVWNEGDKEYGSHCVNVDEPIYVDGNVNFNATTFQGKGIIQAKKNIVYNVNQLTTETDSKLFLASEEGDITLNGTNLKMDSVIYAPNGCVRINANEVNLNGRIIAKNIYINGTLINICAGNDDYDSIDFIFGNEIKLTASGNKKVNRKVVFDAEFSDESNKEAELKDVAWNICKEGKNTDAYRVDKTKSNDFHKEMLFTEAGIYQVTITALNGTTEIQKEIEIVIEEDIAPKADFTLTQKIVGRDKEGAASLTITDNSVSLDGDEIGSRTWFIYYDKNNDGIFSEDEKEKISEENEEKVTYTTKKVGKYKVLLKVKETFMDTIPELLSEDAYLTDTTEEYEKDSCVFEVGNKAPIANLDIRKENAADIVFALGEADQDSVEIYEKKAKELEKQLKKQGVDAKVDTVETSAFRAQDTFAWKEFDHYNYNDRWLPTQEKHIIYDGSDIRMEGYSQKAMRDFLYVEDNDPGKKTFEFDMEKDKTNWHSMEGGGFLFHASVSEENNKIQGFLVLVTEYYLRIIQVDYQLDRFRDGYIRYSYNAGKVLKSYRITNAGKEHHFRIETDADAVSVWDNDTLIVDDYKLPQTNYGYGYGPIVCHGEHSCSQKSYFTFNNIVMSAVKGKSLSDILAGYEWRKGASRHVINLSEKEVPELSTEENTADFAKILLGNNVSFDGIGNETNENQYRGLLNAVQTGGNVYELNDMQASMDQLNNNLTERILAKKTDIETYITTDDRVSYGKVYEDSDGDEMKEAKWMYEYTPELFASEDDKRQVLKKEYDSPIEIFEKTGAYALWLSVKDNAAGDNEAMESYNKWSEEAEAKRLLLVNQRPEAKVTAEVIEDKNNKSKCTVNTIYEAEDKDHPEDSTKGIRKEWYRYKKITEAEWEEGRFPNKADVGETYLIWYQVEDMEGVKSFPAIAVVKTKECRTYEEEKDENPPVVHIIPERLSMNVGETISIRGYAEDDYGIEKFSMTINGEQFLDSVGVAEYTAKEEGNLTVTAKAEDVAGNAAEETITIEVVDSRDRKAPTAVITSPKSGSDIGTSIRIKGTVKDETAFDSYILSYRKQGDENYTTIASGTEQIEDDVLGVLDIFGLKEGVYEILLTAKDKAGNEKNTGLLLYIENKTMTEEISYEMKAVISGIVYEEKTEKIHIYGTADAQGYMESYQLLFAQEGDTLQEISNGTDEVNEKLLGSVDAKSLQTGTYHVQFVVKDKYGNEVTATAAFTFSITENISEVTVTEVVNPEPAVPTVAPTPTVTSTAIPSVTPKATPAATPSIVPVETPAASSLPDVDPGELDDVLNRTFGITLSQDIAYTGTEVTAYVTLPVTVKQDSVQIIMEKDGKTKTLTEGKKSAVFSLEEPGKVIIRAIGTNHLGETIQDSKECAFYDKGDKTYPMTAFDSPEGDAVLTEPVDIVGSAYDEKKLDYWQLEYRRTGTEEYVLLAEGTESVKNSVLANFDTTMVPNGQYEMRLTAVDMGGNRSRITRKYVVEGNLKVGAMNLGFTDITAAMGGAKVNVNRTYNSSNKAKGDFGYGWSLGVQGMTLSENTPLSNGYELLVGGSWFAPSYALEQTKNHDIVVDYGDGTSDRFELKISPDRRTILPIHEVELTYRCVTNPKVKLEIDGDCTAIIENTGMLFNDTSMYSKVKYKLTTEDGIAIYLSAKDGVTKIIDKYGNKIRVDEDGYHSDDGRSILFTRDNEDRVVSAAHPNGKTTIYTYDSDGNLATVTDAADRTVTFTYDDDHNLISITDPTGAAVARNEYDETGRLIAIIDADGNRTEYDYDIEGRTQVIKDGRGNSTLYLYDDKGNVLQSTDAYGNISTNTYDEYGYVLSNTDENGNTTTYEYDKSGNTTLVTAADGTAVTNSYTHDNHVSDIKLLGVTTMVVDYDEQGQIDSIQDANGNVTDYSYTSDGKLTSLADEIGVYQRLIYDENGNVSSTCNGEGETISYEYDQEGKCVSATVEREENGEIVAFTTRYVYNDIGEMTQCIDYAGNITSFTFDEKGNRTSSIDNKGRQTNYEYDVYGNMTKVSYADGTFEEYKYDANGNNIIATDRNGQSVKMEYDKLDRLVKMCYEDGTSEEFSYDPVGNLIEETARNGAKTLYEYDVRNRNIAVIDAYGNKTTFVYDKASRIVKSVDALGNEVSYEYDGNSNLVKTTYADGNSVTAKYDARNRIISQKDQNGNQTKYVYDNADRLIQVIDAYENIYEYGYDELGNLNSVTDALGRTTTYMYDGFGRILSVKNAQGYEAFFQYDQTGNMIEYKDYAGVKTSYIYDDTDRLLEKQVGERKTVYIYNSKDLLSQVKDNSGTIKYQYDNYGRVTAKTDINGVTISYGYDEYGRLQTIDNGFGTTSYSYDLMERITKVVDRNGKATLYEYDKLGNRSAVHYPNGMIVSYIYDACQRLKEECVTDANGTLLAKYSYGLGKVGERLTVTEECDGKIMQISYEYDKLNRLTNETHQCGNNVLKKSYMYDEVSNRIKKTVEIEGDVSKFGDVDNENLSIVEGTISYTYNEMNQLITESSELGTIEYSYDLNGNRTSVTGLKEATYVYDEENRLTKASVRKANGVVNESYTYDYLGNRISKIINAEDTICYVVDDSSDLDQVVAEVDSKGKELVSYTMGMERLSMDRDGLTYYYQYDGHGDVRSLVGDKGSTMSQYTYDAYGELLTQKGDVQNDFLYTGEQYNANTNLYYLRARFMDPSTGTFTSMDTYQGSSCDPVSLHKYLYANANPVKYVDPSGHMGIATMLGRMAGEANITAAKVQRDSWALTVGMAAMAQFTALAVMQSAVNVSADFLNNVGINEAFLGGQIANDISAEMIYNVVDVIVHSYVMTGECVALGYMSSVIEESKAHVQEIAIALDNLDRKSYRGNCVYLLMDSELDNKVSYVGITNDPWRRKKEHEKDSSKYTESGVPWDMYIVKDGLTRREARSLEQALICIYTIEALANARYEIAEKNYANFEKEFQRAASIAKIPLNDLMKAMKRK